MRSWCIASGTSSDGHSTSFTIPAHTDVAPLARLIQLRRQYPAAYFRPDIVFGVRTRFSILDCHVLLGFQGSRGSRRIKK